MDAHCVAIIQYLTAARDLARLRGITTEVEMRPGKAIVRYRIQGDPHWYPIPVTLPPYCK